jgi:hypothetical protein
MQPVGLQKNSLRQANVCRSIPDEARSSGRSCRSRDFWRQVPLSTKPVGRLALHRQSRLGPREKTVSCEANAVSFWKAEQLLALATLVAARHAGVTLDDVIERFSVSKRTAQLRALEGTRW